MTKVFIAAPINKRKNYCLDNYFIQVRNITYPNKQYYFVDNSADMTFTYQCTATYGFDIDWCSPKGRTNSQYMLASQRMIRKKFLESNCTHLFFWECDISLPEDILETLLCHNKQIVGVPYFIQHGTRSFLMQTEIERTFKKYTNKHKDFRKSFIESDGQLHRADMIGFGAVLIKREILEETDFEINFAKKVHADTYFYQDMYDKGIKVYQDNSIIAMHDNRKWSTVTDR